MSRAKDARGYRSERRATQARETRRRILAAARASFVKDGFVATSIDAIARRAKVAAPTVYAIFGSKRAILTAIADQLSADTRDAAGVDDPAELLRLDVRAQVRTLARFQRLHGDIGGDILQMVQGTALVDPDAAALVTQREAARRRRSAMFVRAWKRRGALRQGVSVPVATDILWALGDPGLYRLLVLKSGWSGDRFERWIRETIEALLLR